MLTSEFTTPLIGNPYYTSKGLIKVFDKHHHFYSVGEIWLERFDEQNYQYIFIPYWEQIKFIPNGVFQGIPGINMDIKKDKYYRVNMIPSFISNRTPSENREDINELLSSVGLDYYDRFEWLLRSNSFCGVDNLVIYKKDDSKEYSIEDVKIETLSIDDIVIINNLGEISNTNGHLIEKIFLLLQSGAKIFIKDENRYLTSIEINTMFYLLKSKLPS